MEKIKFFEIQKSDMFINAIYSGIDNLTYRCLHLLHHVAYKYLKFLKIYNFPLKNPAEKIS